MTEISISELPKSALIGDVSALDNGGLGLRFDVRSTNKNKLGEGVIPAFVVRFDDQLFAYLNRCGHIAVQLDFQLGDFFSDDKQTLMCATHGAEYAPDSGQCLGGPCNGVGLEILDIDEEDGLLYLITKEYEVVEDYV